MDAGDITADLAKEVHGLPIYAWVLIGAVGIYVGYRYFGGKSSGVSSTGSDSSVGGDDSGTYAQAGSGGETLATNTTTPTVSNTSVTATIYPDNVAWGVAAVAGLVAHGYNAITAEQAIYAYVNGESITSDQQTLINLAVALVGTPPDLIKAHLAPAAAAPTTTTKTPTTKTTTPTTTTKTTTPTTTTKTTTPTTSANPYAKCAALAPGKASFGYIEIGQRGAKVTSLQHALVAKGFNPGTIDGVFGVRTLAAVTNLQRKYGLKPDGIVGRQTACVLGMS